MPEALGLNQALGYECQRRAWGRARCRTVVPSTHCAAVTKDEGQKKKNRSLPLLDLILINAAVGGTCWDATLYSLLSRAHRS